MFSLMPPLPLFLLYRCSRVSPLKIDRSWIGSNCSAPAPEEVHSCRDRSTCVCHRQYTLQVSENTSVQKWQILQLEVQPMHEVAHRRRTMRGCDLVSRTKKFIWGKFNMNPWKRPTPGP